MHRQHLFGQSLSASIRRKSIRDKEIYLFYFFHPKPTSGILVLKIGIKGFAQKSVLAEKRDLNEVQVRKRREKLFEQAM